MSLRAGLAAFITAALWLAGAAFMLDLQSVGPGAYFSSLFFQHGAQDLRCFLLAAGALLAGGFAIVSSITAFRDSDDDDDDAFPFGAIPFFLVASLGFFWFAIDCVATKPIDEPDMLQKMIDASPAAFDSLAPVEPELLSNLETPIDISAPVAEDRSPAPEVNALPNAASWPYQYPLIRNNGYLPSSATDAFLANLFPADDRDGAMRALLCGKAWVAISGASSQEGPALRNRLRSHFRAELAALNALDWLNVRPDDCRPPAVLALDLGQHLSTVTNVPAGGGATGYQRQVLIVSRQLALDESALDPADALSELQAFLSEPENRVALLGKRRYHQAPLAFTPEN